MRFAFPPYELTSLFLTAILDLWQCDIGGKGNGKERVGCGSGPGEAATNINLVRNGVKPSFSYKKDSNGEEG
jgi:hypothetical protein